MTTDRHAAVPRTAPAAAAIPFPRAVLFDLFHTLVSVRPAADTGTYTWDELGVPQREWERVLFADRPGRAVGRIRDAVEGFRLLAHELDPAIPLERIERAAIRRMQRFERTLENPEPAVVDAVARLRRAGVKIGLVSNAGHDEIGAWPRSPLAPHFDATVFSCDVGLVKPDPAIYHTALTRLGVEAKDAVFVGDGGSDEHRGARAAGVRPVGVTRMAGDVWPDRAHDRVQHADAVHEDVVGFVDHLLGERVLSEGFPAFRVAVEDPDLVLGLVTARGLTIGPSPAPLAAELDRTVAERGAGEWPPEPVRAAVRDLLRRGGYKPTGRGKPASEFLAQAAARGEFPRICNAVDALNLVSLDTGLPISLLDTDRAGAGGAPLVVRYGRPGESFVFNAGGQTIDVAGLLSVARGWGAPLANPVKDSMESKLRPESRNVLAVIFGSRRIVTATAMQAVAERLAGLFAAHCGAAEAAATTIPGD